MDPLTIAALTAVIGGAGLQYKAQTDAANARNREIAQSLMNQRKLQVEAEKKALDTAQTFNTPDRMKEQAALEQTIEQGLMQPVSDSQAIRAQQTTTQGNVSNEYQTAKAASDAAVLKDAHMLARLMSKTTGANRLRMNEGLRMMDASMDIDRLGSFSRGQNAADQVAIEVAGRPDAGMQLAGGVLQGLGTVGLMGGFGGKAASAPAKAAGGLSPTGLAVGAAPLPAAAKAAGGLSPMGLAVGSGALLAPSLLRKW